MGLCQPSAQAPATAHNLVLLSCKCRPQRPVAAPHYQHCTLLCCRSPRQDRRDSASLGPGQYEVAARRVAIDPSKGTVMAFRSTSPGRREVAERETAFRAPGPAAYSPKTAPPRQSFHVPPAIRARIMQRVASQRDSPQPRSEVPSQLPVAPLAA